MEANIIAEHGTNNSHIEANIICTRNKFCNRRYLCCYILLDRSRFQLDLKSMVFVQIFFAWKEKQIVIGQSFCYMEANLHCIRSKI